MISAKEGEEGSASPVPNDNNEENADESKGENNNKQALIESSGNNEPMTTSAKKIKLPPPKSLEEIEREVAENTRKFDERVIGEEDVVKPVKKAKKAGEDKDEKKETDEKEVEGKKGVNDPKKEEIIKKLKSKTQQKYVIEPATAMRILRFFLIICVASLVGFRIVQRNQGEAMKRFQQMEGSWVRILCILVFMIYVYCCYLFYLNRKLMNSTWITNSRVSTLLWVPVVRRVLELGCNSSNRK
jgi:hypothetical protein